jgi:hypothetical protein
MIKQASLMALVALAATGRQKERIDGTKRAPRLPKHSPIGNDCALKPPSNAGLAQR